MKRFCALLSTCLSPLRLGRFWPFLLLFTSLSVLSDGISEKGLKRLLRSKILMAQGIAANDIIVNAVLSQNAKALTLDNIIELDEQWRAEHDFSELKLAHQQNPPGIYIKDVIETAPDIFSEIFVTDNQGANVAAYPATTDYWQGDEDKWIHAWAKGKGDIFLSKVHLDESANVHAIQIGVPIRHQGKVIGVLVTGIKLTHVQSSYLLKNLDKRLIGQ